VYWNWLVGWYQDAISCLMPLSSFAITIKM